MKISLMMPLTGEPTPPELLTEEHDGRWCASVRMWERLSASVVRPVMFHGEAPTLGEALELAAGQLKRAEKDGVNPGATSPGAQPP